jgi:hypothetical protein
MPMRIRGLTPNLVSSAPAAAASFSWIKSAARHARSGASSKATGAPKMAIIPSPVKPRTEPPCSRTASSIKRAMACINVKAASSPDRSEKEVKPTMSVKSTVFRRSPVSKPCAPLPQLRNIRCYQAGVGDFFRRFEVAFFCLGFSKLLLRAIRRVSLHAPSPAGKQQFASARLRSSMASVPPVPVVGDFAAPQHPRIKAESRASDTSLG